MKSIMDTYEARYNEIVKEHENGDREVSYELTGKGLLRLKKIWLDWMRLLRCVWQIWKDILPVNRQTKPLKIRTAPGISIETVPEMKEKHKTGFSFSTQNIGIRQYQ